MISYEYPNNPYSFFSTKKMDAAIKKEKEDFKKEEMKDENV